jgi:hypothetical protein
MRKKRYETENAGILIIEFEQDGVWEMYFDTPERAMERLIELVQQYENVKCATTDPAGNMVVII